MFVINEWLERYEVNDKGDQAQPGNKLRVKPLDYIRSKVHGRSCGAGFSAMQFHAGERSYEVFGLFQKFLEIAASENCEKRGCLLNARGEPADIEDLAFMLRTRAEAIEFTMQVLLNKKVAWIFEVSDDVFRKFRENPEGFESLYQSALSENSGKIRKSKKNKNPQFQPKNELSENSGKNPEIPEPLLTEPNRTEEKTTEDNRTECLRESQENPENQNEQGTQNQFKEDFGLGDFKATSFRFRLVTALEKVLGARTSSDRKSLQNLVKWLDLQVVAKRFDDGVYLNVLDIARESKNGSRKPLAVFFAKLDERIGYRAKAAKEIRDSL